MLGTILIVILVLALFGALPRWNHSRNWGYYPSSGFGVVAVRLPRRVPRPPTSTAHWLTVARGMRGVPWRRSSFGPVGSAGRYVSLRGARQQRNPCGWWCSAAGERPRASGLGPMASQAAGIRYRGTAMRWPRACPVTGRAGFGAPGNAGGPAQAA